MGSNGWIKLHRDILKWEWYSDHNTTRLFIHLLTKANHADNEWKGIKIPTGSLVTGRKVLSAETGLSEQQIRSSLIKLKSTKEITIKPTNKFSVITLCNWGHYQADEKKVTNKNANEQPTNNQQITTNKKDKNVKKESAVADGEAFDAETDNARAVQSRAIAVAKKAVGDSECSPAMKKLLVEWAEYKIHSGKPINAVTLRKIFTTNVGDEARLSSGIAYSIEGGYSRIYEKKADGGGNRHKAPPRKQQRIQSI